MGVNRLDLVVARPFVERQEIIRAKTGGIGSDVEECIGGLGQARTFENQATGRKRWKVSLALRPDRVEAVD